MPLTPADRAWIVLLVCVAVAVATGIVTAMFILGAGLGDVRVSAAAGGTTFGVVLATLIVWRAMR